MIAGSQEQTLYKVDKSREGNNILIYSYMIATKNVKTATMSSVCL